MKDITIIGAGLSGLLAAWRLEQKGYSVQILEARERLGGRIHTKTSSDGTKLEMGATWFGTQHINLIALIQELELTYYPQHMDGKAFFEAFSTAPPQAIDLPNESPSFRIKGGTDSLIDSIFIRLLKTNICFNTVVKNIEYKEDAFMLNTSNKAYGSKYVISTIPPALFIDSISTRPSLPLNIKSIAKETQTWMQDSIKVGITYKNAFWREMAYSGTLFSNVGPVTEFYDHCDSMTEMFALCGFVKSNYFSMDRKILKEMILKQIIKSFGEKAGDFIDFEMRIWKNEEFTYSKINANTFPHQNNGHPILKQAVFDNHFFIAGTETSSWYGGYMEGAVIRINELMQYF